MSQGNKWNFDPENPPPAEAGFFGMEVAAAAAGVVILPIPFEATTSYGQGTRFGPEAMRVASHQLDFFDRTLGRPYEHGIATYGLGQSEAETSFLNWVETKNAEAYKHVCAYREAPNSETLNAVNEIGRALRDKTKDLVSNWIGAGKLVCSIGGDHSVSLGPMLAALEHFPDMGVLHLDAHADLRESYEDFQYSHASVMFNVLAESNLKRLVSFGIRDFCEEEYQRIQSDDRVHVLFAEQVFEQVHCGESFDKIATTLVDQLPEQVYLSFDIDGLDPQLCPNTGTPVPGGLSLAQVLHVLTVVRKSGRRIVGLDLVEVAPSVPPGTADGDPAAEWDGNVGARLLYKMIGNALATVR